MTGLEKAYNQVSAELAKKKIETILLSSDQMLVSRNIMTNTAPVGFKVLSRVPAPDGYAIYIRTCPLGADQGRPQQRVSSAIPTIRWDANTMRLLLDRTSLDQSWRLLNSAGVLISFTVYCGSKQMFDEVDVVLTILSRFLLG